MTSLWSDLCILALILTLFHLFSHETTGSTIVKEGPGNLADCPRIVSRKEWKARNATKPYTSLSYKPAPFVVIHHGGMLDYCYDETGCANVVRSYQNLHMDVNHWADIGYNFVIGEDGHVYDGRGWDYVGARAPPYNNQSIGICTIGDFSHFIPTSPARKALTSLIACGVELGKIRPDYQIIGHRQARKTVCPGEVFYEWVQKLPG